eukprot:TRINITY_DN13049_c0_g1_i1.p1 TRINITY_DN13049_c0_g1~~TRINITY_DN13049_c0_g1_i1.p1  ORF type:complete len:686 (+),score=141.28 TRINITY_DN13049_c0_g1_i1:34-2091(+)
MRILTLIGLTGLGAANMIDVIEDYKAPPTNCVYGCDDWKNINSSYWKDGKVPTNAGNHCAQPGAVVNDYHLGAWCVCAPRNATDGETDESLPPASWDFLGNFRCETDKKQFGDTPPPGFLYDTQPGLTGSLYYKDKITLTECESLCHNNLTNCDFVSWGNGGWCYVSEWCQNQVASGSYQTYNDGAKPVPPAPTPEPTKRGYCTSLMGVPEQINIQIASPNSVVLSFVTFESATPKSPPTAMVNSTTTTFTGVTHNHTTHAGDRVYFMHFILVDNLQPKQMYTYKVKSGSPAAQWSAEYTFRAPHDEGETKVNIYGDLGIYWWNSLEWLQKDCLEGESDLIIHMGDHAYNEGQDDEKRGDSYMNGFQPVLSQCSWLPNVGNHEFYDGADIQRYLDSTWEQYQLPRSTATSALGYLLSTASHNGAGLQSSTPSGTSRYFSVDIGLFHFIALDLNIYYNTDVCGDPCRKAQLAWLEQDLIAANKNRESKPWVIAFSHFPLFCTGCNVDNLAAYYDSEEAEHFGINNKTESQAWGRSAAHLDLLKKKGYKDQSTGVSSAQTIKELHPLFEKYGLDMYLAGHWHYYESLFPSMPGNSSCLPCAVPTQQNFNEPNTTVHVTTGNAGPPGPNSFVDPIPASRFRSTEYGYGRLTAHNKTHLTYTQFLNSNGTEQDSFTIYQPNHGPFSLKK